MIQGAINQLIGIAAAAKKASDLTKAKEERSAAQEVKAQYKAQMQANRAAQARERAMQRTRDSITAKYNQDREYQAFLKTLGPNQAPEELKRIAFEAQRNTPEVRIGGEKIDISKLSPEAQAAIRGAK